MIKKTRIENVLELITPTAPLPVVFDSPHSGQIYPDDFGYNCDLSLLTQIEDKYVDELFDSAHEHNAYFLRALFPRSYVDLNRASDDIDDLLVDGSWPDDLPPIAPTARSHSGIGLFPRLIKAGTPIYNRRLSAVEIMDRVKTYYEPYHDTLCATLDAAYYNHAYVWHINCHSMPSSSAYSKHQTTLVKKQSDIVLGNLDGTTCDRQFTNMLKEFWQSLGYHVTINDPFKGVELISRYSAPTRARHSIQIEINRALYMDEKTGKKIKNFDVIKQHCTDMVKRCADYAQSQNAQIAAD